MAFFRQNVFFNSPPIASRSGDCDRPLGRGKGAGQNPLDLLNRVSLPSVTLATESSTLFAMSRLCQSTKSTDSESFSWTSSFEIH